MKVKELIERLKEYPEDLDVIVNVPFTIADTSEITSLEELDNQSYTLLNTETNTFDINRRGKAILIS